MNSLFLILLMICFALIAACILLNEDRKRLKKEKSRDMYQKLNYMMQLLQLEHTNRLIPEECLKEISKVLEHGAKKYSPNGWKHIVHFCHKDLGWTNPLEFYMYKAKAHIEKYLKNDFVLEKESGCHHLVHAIVNLMFAYWHDIN